MEVTVLEATNPPPKAVVAIHAGSVRRQARMEVNHTFQMPRPGSDAYGIQVTLFQQLTSQILPVNDGRKEVICHIPVQCPDGTSSQVKLSIKRDPPKALKPSEDTVRATREYLEQHRLQQRIQCLIQELLKAQPTDPYRYMVQCLKNGMDSLAPAVPTTEPTREVAATQDLLDAKEAAPEAETPPQVMQPKPPAGPPPAAASPTFRRARLTSSKESNAGSKDGVAQPAPGQEAPEPEVTAHQATEPQEPELQEPELQAPAEEALEPQESAPEAPEHVAPAPATPEPATPERPQTPGADVQSREEARVAARASILMILGMPLCLQVAEEEIRERTQTEIAKRRTPDILESARRTMLDEVARSNDTQFQARVSLRAVYQRSSVLASPQFLRAVTRVAVKSLLCGAARRLGEDPERRKDCLDVQERSRSQTAIPTPIVNLNLEGGSWGRWLSEGGGPREPLV